MARSGLSGSPFDKVSSEVGQAHSLRKPVLKRLEKHFDAKVVTLFTSFRNQEAQLVDDDAEMLESLLAAEHDGEKFFLILNSPGGQALAAERIVNVCRAYSGDQFEVVVPHMAKSAATMICFGASVIHMSKTAELGPVDPQVPFSDDRGVARWISAEEYVRSYDQLMEKAGSGEVERIEPYLQQLNRYDARYIEALKSVQALSKDISVGLLKSGMLSELSPEEIEKKIEVFLSQQQTSAHGRMINHDGVEKCGLDVKLIDLRSRVWNDIWEVYVRSDWAVSTNCSKLIESARTSLRV